jgi:hypothetical protein
MTRGLALAPLIPALLTTPIFYFLGFAPDVRFVSEVAMILIFVIGAVIWSITTGLIWLYTVARWRGRIGLLGCIVLGAVCSFFFPMFSTIGASLLMGPDPELTSDYGLMILLFSLPGLLAGLLGGWIFWRIAVRTVPPPLEDLAAIFDA